MTINDAIASRIISLLRKNKMTKYRLENNANIKHSVMSNIISGKNKTITLTTLFKICNGFNISILEFLDDDLFNSNNLDYD